MDTRNHGMLTARAEFYLCLARAFLVPLRTESFNGMRDALGDDLAELSSALGYAGAGAIAAYRDAIIATPDHATLLQHYSALFVSVPRTLQINAGAYLDGAINGGSVAAMESAYRSCGVERGAHFHDLSDHVSVQLEFIALLYLRSAQALDDGADMPPVRPEHFLHEFVARWLPRFIRDLESADVSPNPWLPLAQLLAVAVAYDAHAEPLPVAEQRARRAIGKARHDRAVRGITEADMAFIAQKLRENGLSTDHLSIPPEMRDEVRGYSRGQPPGPRKYSGYE